MKNKSMIGIYLIVLILSITVLGLTIYIQNLPTPQETTDTTTETTFGEPPIISCVTGILIKVMPATPEKDIPILVKEDGQPNVTIFYLRGEWYLDAFIGSQVMVTYITAYENKNFAIEVTPL
jgi:hypothetical protein